MADCVDFFKRAVAAKNPNMPSSPNSAAYSFDGTGDLRTAVANDRAVEAADATFRNTAAEQITELMGPEDSSELAPPLERGDASRVADIRYSLLRRDTEQSYDILRYRRLQDELARVNGNTTGEVTWWQAATTKVSGWLANRKAPFALFLQLYQNDKVLGSILNREEFSKLSHMEARIMGERERLSKPALTELNALAEEIARDIGLPSRVNEVKQIIGDYAMFRHILDDGANYALMNRWQRRINYINNLPPQQQGDYAVERARLVYDLNQLANNVDNPNPPAKLSSVGFTDGEARVLMAEIRKLGIDENKLIRGADRLVKWNEDLFEADGKAGKVSPDQYDRIKQNGFKYYVPIMHRSNNATGYINDTHPYYEANYQVRMGSDDIPDDAFTSTIMRANRVAGHIATRDFSDTLMVMAQQNMDNIKNPKLPNWEDNGLRIYSLEEIENAKNKRIVGNEALADWAATAERSGGFVVEKPKIDNGHIVGTERSLVYFAPNWKGRGGLTGAALNDALLFNQSGTINNGIGRVMTKANSLYGQSFTRYRPWFGIVNSGRDAFERFTHISNRDYVDANGNIIQGWKLLGKYAKNVASAYVNLPVMFRQMKKGTFNMNSPEGQIWQDFVRYGVHQDYTWGRDAGDYIQQNLMAPRGSRATSGLPKYLQGKGTNGIRNAIELLEERPRRALLEKLDNFNDYWNNVAAYAHFKTLREANIPPDRAARNTLDSMDFAQQGSRTALLRCFFPFVKPIAQSAASMSRVLGFTFDTRGFAKASWKGYAMLTGLALGMKGMMAFAQDSMGADEDGNPRIDQLSLSKLSRGIPIGLDDETGSFFFLNTGYGAPRLLNTILWGADRVQRGLLDPSSFAGSVLLTYIQEMTPGNWPEFSFKENPADYIIQSVMPAFLSPVAEVATGKNAFGRNLKPWGSPEGIAHADYGGGSTGKAYNNLAQIIYRTTGFDFYPEEIQHIIESYANGPAVLIRAALESVFGDDGPDIKDTEHYKATHLHPVLEALGATMSFGYADDVARSLFYQAERQILDTIKKNRIRQSSSTAYKRGDEAAQERWWRDQCEEAGLEDDYIEDIIRYFRAAKALHSGSKEINAYLRNEISSDIDYDDLLEKFEERTASRRQVFRDYVSEANMFNRR